MSSANESAVEVRELQATLAVIMGAAGFEPATSRV